jgi:Tol biopolymer transport system component
MRRILLLCGALMLVVGIAPSGHAQTASPYPIVYMSVHDDVGAGDIHLLRNGVDQSVQAADSNGHDCGPAFRPGGGFLALESNRADEGGLPGMPSFDLYLLDVRTGRVTRLTHGGGEFPTWSPDGRRIAFSSNGIAVINADGSGRRQITRQTGGASHMFPAWSPDGKKIAFTVAHYVPGTLTSVRPPEIWVMDPNGRHLRRLTADGEFANWSPDSKRLVYDRASGRVNPFETDLYTMRADGSHQRLLNRQAGSDLMAYWSPDGDHIAYVHVDSYWTGVVAPLMLPAAGGQDVFADGGSARIWQLTLGDDGRVFGRERLSSGITDLFPHYAPLRNPM